MPSAYSNMFMCMVCPRFPYYADDPIPDEPLFLLWGCVNEDEDEQRQTTDDDPHKAGSDDAGDKAPNAADSDKILQLGADQPRSALQQQASPAFRARRPLRTDAAPHHSTRFQDLLSGKTMPQLGGSRGAQPATAALSLNTDNSEPRPEAKPAAAETARAAGGSGPVRRSRRIMLQPVRSGRSQVTTGPSAGLSAAAKQSGPGGVAKRKRARDEEEIPEPKRAKKRKEPRNAYVAACLRETSGRESGGSVRYPPLDRGWAGTRHAPWTSAHWQCRMDTGVMGR